MKKSMKNTFELFKLDWKRIFKNKLTFVLIIALMIIPSLYAWFNIAALWDPYSNTKDISIAVYSDDETVDIMDNEVNIGDKIVENLKDNDTIGWRFVDSKKELDRGVKSGKYYAGIYMPKDFSKNLISFLDGDIKKPEIDYSVNQKINAIAPKIADKGAGTIKETISTEFVDTVSETVLTVFNEVGYDLDSNMVSITKVSNKILSIDNNLDEIEGYTKEIQELNKKMPEYKGKLNKANEFITFLPEVDKMGDKVIEANKMMPKVKKSGKTVVSLQKKIPEIKNAGRQIAMVDNDFDDVVKMMDEAIVEANKGVGVIKNAQKELPKVLEIANKANEVIPAIKEPIESLIVSMNQVNEAIDAGLDLILVTTDSISTLAGALEKDVSVENQQKLLFGLRELDNRIDTQIGLITSVRGMLENIQNIAGNTLLQPVIDRLNGSLNDMAGLKNLVAKLTADATNMTPEKIAEIKGNLQKIQSDATIVGNAINSINRQELYQEMEKILKDMNVILNDVGQITNKIDQNKINEINSLLNNTTSTITQAVGFLQKYQQELPAIKQEIHSANELLNGNMNTIVGAINKSVDVYQKDLPVLENKLAKASHFIQNDWPGVEKDLNDTMTMVNKKMPEVETALSDADKMIVNDWPNIKEGIHKAADGIRKGQKDIDLKELVKLLKSDVKSESDFISNPVELNHKDIYPVPNYGSASAPFYTALCLWVGSVLLSSIASTEIYLEEEDQKKYSKRQQFLARMMTFLVIGFFQALIVSLGNLFLLNTYAVSPVWSVIFALIVGLTFMMMVYVLVALFGNLGKGLAVIILVLSISGGGGNFPIEMSGKFFRMINPLLPFTHAVNLLREPVGGIYWPNAIKALIIMVALFILFFAVGLAAYPKVKSLFKKLNNYLHEGHILH